jgi:hypothetical protein
MSTSFDNKATGSEFDINRFQQLLDRLEASKKRQVTQKGQIGRGDIYAQGLASMMSNF